MTVTTQTWLNKGKETTDGLAWAQTVAAKCAATETAWNWQSFDTDFEAS